MPTLPSDPDLLDRVLVDIGREALKHARELHRSSALILDAGIWSVAYATSALALEEIGKTTLCTYILTLPDPERQVEVDAFPKKFASHEAKSFLGFLVLRMIEDSASTDWMEIYKRADRDAKRTHKNKMRGLYVDYKQTGHLLKPTDITKAQAADMIDTVERALAFSVDAEDALDNAEVFLPMMRQFRGATGAGGALSDENLETLLPAIMAAARGEIEPEEALKGTALGALIEKMADTIADTLTPEQLAAFAVKHGGTAVT